MLSDTSSSENETSVRVSESQCVPRVHSHSQGVEGARAASFVHQNRFAELSGDDTVSVLPQGSFVPQAKNVGPHHRRRRRVRSEGSDPEHLTLIDSSDENAPFVVKARPSHRLVLVPESQMPLHSRSRTVSWTPGWTVRVQHSGRVGLNSQCWKRGDTLVSSDEEPVPCSRNSAVCMGSTKPASTGALLDVGVEESQFVRTVAPRVDERSRDIDPTQFQTQCQPDVATPSRQRRVVDALEFDLTRCDSPEDSLSDTASCTHVARRRRLSFVWSAEGGERQAAQVSEEAMPQDSHEQRFKRVRAAMQEERQHATHRQA